MTPVTASQVERLSQRLVLNAQVVGIGEALALLEVERARHEQRRGLALARGEEELYKAIRTALRARRIALAALAGELELGEYVRPTSLRGADVPEAVSPATGEEAPL